MQHVPGKFFITSMKSGGEREKGSKKEGKSGDRWRNIEGGVSYKKRRKEGEYEE